MSLIKFELKENHLKLLKYLQWSKTETNHFLSIANLDNDDAEDVILTPFGGDNLIEDIGHIIYGRPEDEDIQPKRRDNEEDEPHIVRIGEVDETFGYSPEQIKEITDLFNGLAMALEICLYTQSFEVGHYKRKYHDRHWIKYEPK